MNAEATTTSTELTVLQRAQVALRSVERERALRELAQASQSIATITNVPGYQQVHSARMALKRQRIELEQSAKTARDEAHQFSKACIAEERRLVSLIAPEENRLQSLQDAWDAERERERQAKLEAERRRLEALRERIDEIRQRPADAAGQSSAEIELYITALVALEIDDTFAELKQEAAGAKETALIRLRSAHAKAVAFEEEQGRLKAERERLRQEREEEERRQAAERARIAEEERQARAAREAEERRLKAEREAEEARAREAQALAESRFGEIQGIQHQVYIATAGRAGVRKGGTRQCIVDTLAETERWEVTAEKFGPLFEMALKAKESVVAQIKEQLAHWDRRATEDERLAEERRQQEDALATERARQREEDARREAQRAEDERKETERREQLAAEERRIAAQRAELEAQQRQLHESSQPSALQVGPGGNGEGLVTIALPTAERDRETTTEQPITFPEPSADWGTVTRLGLVAEGYVDIVFDGPPSAEGPRFIEVEDSERKSISFGEWIERDDGHWALRIPCSLAFAADVEETSPERPG